MMRRIGQFSAYLGVGALSLGLAFYLSTSFLDRSHSQSPGETPPPQPGGYVPPPQDANQQNQQNQAANSITSQLEGFLEPYIYDPKGRRDPFKPYVEVKPPEEGEVAGPLLPLQQYDVDQLKLIGVIWDVADPKGMFLDPKGKIHIVRRDERIGRKNGYVAVIREGEVVVVESVNVNGDLMYSTRVLKIVSRSTKSGAK